MGLSLGSFDKDSRISTSEKLGWLLDFDRNRCLSVGNKEVDDFFSEVFVGFFTSSQRKFNFDFVPTFQEFDALMKTDVSVVGADTDGEADDFHVDLFLLCFLFLGFFFLLVLELAVVQNLTHRRIRHRGDFDQVEFFFFGNREGFRGRHLAQHLSLFIDHAYNLSLNTLICLVFCQVELGTVLSMSMNSHRSEASLTKESQKIKLSGMLFPSMSTLAFNKRAKFDYELLETFEGGLVLTGVEVKSVKAGHVQFKNAFLDIKRGELWLKNAFISKYGPAGEQPAYVPDRDRKVLVHKRQLKRFIGKKKTEGLTMVPVSLYLSHNRIKLEFALAKGKKQFEKRESIKERDANRAIRAALKGVRV